jgi:hypothetical protein
MHNGNELQQLQRTATTATVGGSRRDPKQQHIMKARKRQKRQFGLSKSRTAVSVLSAFSVF